MRGDRLQFLLWLFFAPKAWHWRLVLITDAWPLQDSHHAFVLELTMMLCSELFGCFCSWCAVWWYFHVLLQLFFQLIWHLSQNEHVRTNRVWRVSKPHHITSYAYCEQGGLNAMAAPAAPRGNMPNNVRDQIELLEDTEWTLALSLSLTLCHCHCRCFYLVTN